MKITVFCGSSKGTRSTYIEAAKNFGECIGEKGWEIVYGGASIGLMGQVAESCLAAGGTVHGIIPGFLDKREIAHSKLTRLTVTDSMHQRKQLMATEADLFVALPGGFGTFEEILEIITWRQLGLHNKPIGFLNVEGFYSDLIDFFKKAKVSGFIRNDLDFYYHVWNSVNQFERFAIDFKNNGLTQQALTLDKT